MNILTWKPRRRDLAACKNLYFRIGVGPSTGPGKRSIPGYGDEALAESALEAFVCGTPLPPPTMIVGCGIVGPQVATGRSPKFHPAHSPRA